MKKAIGEAESGRGPREDRGVISARIISAARDEFIEQGVSGATFRAIARRADVDPALVHYYFASKERLLDAATTPPPDFLDNTQTAISAPLAIRGQRIIEHVVSSWAAPSTGPILYATFLCANVDERTREKLRASMSANFIGATSQRLPQRDRLLRAGLVSSQIVGLCWHRYIWKLDPLATMSDRDVISAVAPTLQKYLNGRM
ncbi:TetR/AcrR family transcriptional regulator [Subtercola lobariae]|nr:TetR family transcriptional regulator [Subtercola lobariae]